MTNMDKSIQFYLVLVIGVLKDESKKTALSGVVLVRDRYAIGIAEDIAKIPLTIFREDTDILFVPSTGQTWVCGLVDYLTHPDYDSRITTIALVELDLEGRGQVPFSAVCWTHGAGAINLNELYTVGYSDGLEGMEYGKMILKLQYVNKTTCEAFYTSNAASAQRFPAKSLCAAAVGPEAKEDCVWDMGQALVSNATGYWTLIGLSVQGPACAEPGRFLNFFHYREWVHSALDPTFREQGYRRTGHGIGFQKNKKAEIQDIPISQTLDYSSRRQGVKAKTNVTKTSNGTKVSNGTKEQNDTDAMNEELRKLAISLFPYPFKDPEAHFDMVVDRVDKDAINISVFESTYEIEQGACHRYNHLIYRDRTRVVAEGKAGLASYRLTLYDMLLNNVTCIQIAAESLSRSKAKLWWTTFLDKGEGTSFKYSGNTPEHMLKLIPVKPLYPKKPDPNGKFDPKDYFHLEAQSIRDQFDTMHIINVNLLVTLEFKDEAMLHLKMYGQPAPRPTTTTTEPPSSTSEQPPVTWAATKMEHLVNESTFNFTVFGIGEPYRSQYPAKGRRSNDEENPYVGSRRIRLWSNDEDDKLREKPHNRKSILRKNGNDDSLNIVRETAHSGEAGVFYSNEGRAEDTESETQNKNIRRKNGNKNSFIGVRETANSRKAGVFYSNEGRVEDTESESQNKKIRRKNGNKNSFIGVRETAHSGKAGVFYSDEERVGENTESASQNKDIRRKNGNNNSFNDVRETVHSSKAGVFYSNEGRAEDTETETQNNNIRRKNGNKNSFIGVRKTANSRKAGVFYSNEGRVEDTESASQNKDIRRKNGNKNSFIGVRETGHSRKAGVFYSNERRAEDTESASQNKDIRRKNVNNNSFNGVREPAHSGKAGVFYNDEERVAENTESKSQNNNIRVRETAHSGEAGVFYSDEGRAEDTVSDSQIKQEEPSLVLWI